MPVFVVEIRVFSVWAKNLLGFYSDLLWSWHCFDISHYQGCGRTARLVSVNTDRVYGNEVEFKMLDKVSFPCGGG